MVGRIVLIWGMAVSASACNPWTYVTGDCSVNNGCALSPQYPAPYGNNTRCSFGVNAACATPLQVWQFDLEGSNSGACASDAVTVNGRRYCGSSGPIGVIPNGSINFSSNSSTGGNGFKLCMSTNGTGAASALWILILIFAACSAPIVICISTMVCMACRKGPAGWQRMSCSLCWASISYILVVISMVAHAISAQNENLLIFTQAAVLVALFLFFMSVCMSTICGFCYTACNYDCTSRCSGILIVLVFVASAAALAFEIILTHGRPASGTYLASGSLVAVGVVVYCLFRITVQIKGPAEYSLFVAAVCFVVVPVLFMVAMTLPYSNIKQKETSKIPKIIGWANAPWYVGFSALQTLITEICALFFFLVLSSSACMSAMHPKSSQICFDLFCSMVDYMMKYGFSTDSLVALMIICVCGFLFDKKSTMLPKDDRIIFEIEKNGVMLDSGFYLALSAMFLSMVSQCMWCHGKLRADQVFMRRTQRTAGLHTLSDVQPNTIGAAANVHTDDPEKTSSAIDVEPALGQ